MSIIAAIVCDVCGVSLAWGHMPQKWVIRWARERGWTVGKMHKCPKCRKQKRSEPDE